MIPSPLLRLSRPLLAAALLLASACGDDVHGPVVIPPSAELLSALIVSNPVRSAWAAGASLSFGGVSEREGVVYVSLPPGSVPSGRKAVVRGRNTEAQAMAQVVDGGFDPIPLEASAGDELDVRIEVHEGGLLEYVAAVPPSRPPVVVRTDPSSEERDVPADAAVLVVFSEPIDATTLTGSSIHLMLDGAQVAGTLQGDGDANLTATFAPGEPLIPGTDYSVRITPAIEDLDGDAIHVELRVDFRTAGLPPPPPPPEVELLLDVTGELDPPDAPAGSVPIAAGLFISGFEMGGAEGADRARQLIADTNDILAQCDLHLAVEAAQVIAVPPHLRPVQGNEFGSWGGHPPAGVGDPDLFMYHENERLTDDTRELFGYGKRNTSQNAIAIFIVDEIEYYIGPERTGAAGLSFPPVIYHHADDYPLRNSVLATNTTGRLIAHELGHMLLNTGDHWGEGANLMLGGTGLTSDQCERMHENRARLFGGDAVPDPGPPITSAAAIAMVSGNAQIGKAGEVLELPFAVRVTDTQGGPVPHVYVSWSVASGAGRLVGGSNRTGAEGTTEKWFVPTAVGVSTVTAAVAEVQGASVTFSVDAPFLVIRLQRANNPWTGDPVGDPFFSGPEGGSDVTVPVMATVEWFLVGVEMARIASTSEPPGGQPFDSGSLENGARFQFVPTVPGTWEFEDQVSGATGTLNVH